MSVSLVLEGIVRSAMRSGKQRIIPKNIQRRFSNPMWVTCMVQVEYLDEMDATGLDLDGASSSLLVLLECLMDVTDSSQSRYAENILRIHEGMLLQPTVFDLPMTQRHFKLSNRESRRVCIELFKEIEDAFKPFYRKTKGGRRWVNSHGSQVWQPNGEFEIASMSEEELAPIATFEASDAFVPVQAAEVKMTTSALTHGSFDETACVSVLSETEVDAFWNAD